SVTSLNSLTSIDISPSREAVEIFPQQEKEPCSRLGSDLLQMYLQQTDADITVRSENGDFRAHKCILAATSPYFQSLIAQAGATATTIDLKYSRNTVDFTLTFLYGGVTFMPPEIDVWEVMSIADHMKLAELTNVARLHLRAKICHLFHRPCAACVSAVFDALPQLHATVALADIFEEALAWQARYFGRIWKGRSFLHLNHRWQNLCFQYLVDNL
uniref:BTB domain-containing protein n=1 Tax=Plectus sambesii TaxID=2011161 RepID=A0A914V635_9BILA